MELLYTDRHIAVCVKQAGMLSQDSGENSVPFALRQQLDAEEVHVVHRLDREVGGVMVYALTKKAAAGLNKAVQAQQLKKIYHAVLRGIPTEESGVQEDLLFHDKTKNKTYVVNRVRKGVKDARLEYTVLRTAGERALVRIQLHTGRTHQIRVQFASRQLPLVGDGKYGGKEAGSALGLWSTELSFPHPITGKTMTFTAKPPEETPWKEFT